MIKVNKCIICNKEIKNDSQFIKGKWYHNDCIENLNSVINELERWLKEMKKYYGLGYYDTTLNKLEELKNNIINS